MQDPAPRKSEVELDYAMAVAERKLRAAGPEDQFAAVCLMAVIVSQYPPGPWQEEAEDRLSAFIGQLQLGPGDLDILRYFRAHGLEDEASNAEA